MPTRKPFVGGNWKMNTNQASASDLTRNLADSIAQNAEVEIAVFPPFPYLLTVGSILKARSTTIHLGAQDVYHEPDGAFTGEVSTAMLADCAAESVLTGHSERRHVLNEPDELINKKTRAALDAGLDVVLCIGETLDQRAVGMTDQVNEQQLRLGLVDVAPEHMVKVVVAYEPVWAIGTGKTATPDDAQAAHAHIRTVLTELYGPDIAQRTRIVYGGSVKPGNAAELFACPDIDGGLIGGASLKVEDFHAIVAAAQAAPAQA